MIGWHVIQTEPKREAAVEVRLHNAGFATYLPKIAAGPGGSYRAPLFPTYLMVEAADHWYSVRWTAGVVRLLMNGMKPAVLATSEVDRLRAKERHGLIQLPKPPPRLVLGAEVRIAAGSFSGLTGIYDGMAGADRVRVLLEIMGQAVPVRLAKADIEPA